MNRCFRMLRTSGWFLIFILCFSAQVSSQCTFNPTVTGNLILCPGATDTLSTQIYGSYQWYKRSFSGTAQPIPGAVMQNLVVDYFNDAGFYFSVEATDNGCTELSPEVLLDGYVFLPPVVQTSGTFTIGPNGETIICAGDTVFFTLMQPYDTNIIWFKDGSPVLGANTTVLTVTDSGLYTVQGAPTVCPDYIQQLGVTLEVNVINCSTGIVSLNLEKIKYYLNRTDHSLYIENIPMQASGARWSLISADGSKLLMGTIPTGQSTIRINLTGKSAGIYFFKIISDSFTFSGKIAVIF